MSDKKEFFRAVSEGQAERVAAMLAADPALARERDEGATALHFAAVNDRREVVDFLLAHGADLEAVDDEFHMTPIGWANEKGHTGMVRHLFERGAHVGLCRAAAFGLVDRALQILGDDRTTVNTTDPFGTPIHEASLWGRPEMVELLLENGADPDLCNTHGRTALEVARRQVESDAGDTPIVTDLRRREIVDGCRRVIEILTRRGAAG